MLNPLNLISKLIKTPNQKELDRLGKTLSKINELEPKFANLNNKDFPEKTKEFKERISKGEPLDSLLPEALACARESAKRSINERPYDVQIIGSIVLHEGKIAEMKTGEGKTLSIALTAYLNALLFLLVSLNKQAELILKFYLLQFSFQQFFLDVGLSLPSFVHQNDVLIRFF